ncbi:SIMPL domain-containing protein [Dyadobacter sandarakinus]|uniref:SIMPL domain-containing protein n=1 Tax=Dyadobacter sandarakinus TaxID=2747268 RepID=A0ABX7I9B5_9BACT|nr:SIMPL domain-containing protein [Dyadobacter sandarakinus]QRR02701.1 SIMPL domain-containing protein [Dyadobacter sandarakinus]
MKKAILLGALLLGAVSFPSFSQTKTSHADTRKIEVAGFSEMEIVPDEIYFNISLREYFEDEKNQKNKVGISTLEKQLIQAVTAAGFPKEALSLSGIGGFQNYIDNKKKPASFLESKQYELKVDKGDKLDAVLAKVDSRGINFANVARVDHSKKEEFKKQVKVAALKDAKEKAGYLVKALDEDLGQVLEIRELDESVYYPQPMMMKARAFTQAEAADAVPDSDVQYQKIKISYRMQAAFEIQ